jgi:hypothetical protein
MVCRTLDANRGNRTGTIPVQSDREQRGAR